MPAASTRGLRRVHPPCDWAARYARPNISGQLTLECGRRMRRRCQGAVPSELLGKYVVAPTLLEDGDHVGAHDWHVRLELIWRQGGRPKVLR